MDLIKVIELHANLVKTHLVEDGESKYQNSFELALDLGQPFIERIAHPHRLKKRDCFPNCLILAINNEDYHYCEGFAQVPGLGGLPFHHAWLLDDNGGVIDPTWHEDSYIGTQYYGVPISTCYAVECTENSEWYGVISYPDSLINGIPLEFLKTIQAPLAGVLSKC